MDISILLIDSMLEKCISEKNGVYQAIKQLSEEDYGIQLQRVTIANLISHIKGPVPQRFETVFFNVADKRDRDKEFERGLHLSKKEALTLANIWYNSDFRRCEIKTPIVSVATSSEYASTYF